MTLRTTGNAQAAYGHQTAHTKDTCAHHELTGAQRVRHLLGLLATGEWHIARYGGTGIPLPWSPQMVITSWCEQALVHAFLAVAPALRRGEVPTLRRETPPCSQKTETDVAYTRS
jgi:hypothetical protein